MSMPAFAEALTGETFAREEGVVYLSRQNDSLREEFGDSALGTDVPAAVPFAAEAFHRASSGVASSPPAGTSEQQQQQQQPPDAVNLWIGDGRSLTSW